MSFPERNTEIKSKIEERRRYQLPCCQMSFCSQIKSFILCVRFSSLVSSRIQKHQRVLGTSLYLQQRKWSVMTTNNPVRWYDLRLVWYLIFDWTILINYIHQPAGRIMVIEVRGVFPGVGPSQEFSRQKQRFPEGHVLVDDA